MCWNASVSLNTFLFSSFAVAMGVGNNIITVPTAIFWMSFISMQLVEFFLWRSITKRKKTANAFWSKVGLFIIFIQPLMSMLRIGVGSGNGRGDGNWLHYWIVVGAYLAFMALVYTVFVPLWTIDFSSERAQNGHLRWNWLTFPAWILLVWVLFLLSNAAYYGEWIDLAVYLLVIGLIYWTYRNTNTWGSLWCWIANAMSLIILGSVFWKDICLR